MRETLKSVSNIFTFAVTILGLVAIFYKTISALEALALLMMVLLIGFISIVFYQISRIESKINTLEEKYKRAEELLDIKARIIGLERQVKK